MLGLLLKLPAPESIENCIAGFGLQTKTIQHSRVKDARNDWQPRQDLLHWHHTQSDFILHDSSKYDLLVQEGHKADMLPLTTTGQQHLFCDLSFGNVRILISWRRCVCCKTA